MRLAWLGVLLATTTVARADPPRMLKGPYLQALAPTSITVMWHFDQAAPAHLVVDGPGGERAVDVAAARIGEATIDRLTPSSRYRYRVEAGGQRWNGEFATAPEVGTDVPFSFIVMGDTRNGVDAHRRVVERMAQEVPDFVVGTGDMVDDGSHEDQWQQFFDVENRLLRDNVYFPAVGNHNRQGRGRTADSYRAFFSVPDNGGDTERYYAFSYAAARFLVLDSNEYSFALSDQTAWLERELIATRPGSRGPSRVRGHAPPAVFDLGPWRLARAARALDAAVREVSGQRGVRRPRSRVRARRAQRAALLRHRRRWRAVPARRTRARSISRR